MLRRLLAANSNPQGTFALQDEAFMARQQVVYFWPLMKRRCLLLRRAYSALRTPSSASPRWRTTSVEQDRGPAAAQQC